MFGTAGDLNWPNSVTGSEPTAIVWTTRDGTRDLNDLAAAAHVAAPAGYHLAGVAAASADGTVVFGSAIDTQDPFLARHGFVLRLPVSAYGL